MNGSLCLSYLSWSLCVIMICFCGFPGFITWNLTDREFRAFFCCVYWCIYIMHIHCSHITTFSIYTWKCSFHWSRKEHEYLRVALVCWRLIDKTEICHIQQYYCSYLTFYFTFSFTASKKWLFLAFHTLESSTLKFIRVFCCLRHIGKKGNWNR